MNILISGNLGYIGSRLTEMLSKKKNNKIFGFDVGFFQNQNLEKIDPLINQTYQDIRRFDEEIFNNKDVLIHLAAMSNDPIGELNPLITQQINYEYAFKFFNSAIKKGVKQIIHLSTQSIYGYADISKEISEDDYDNINPITEYAKSKWKLELSLQELKKDAHITILRPSTVFGYSKRLRSDIVLNNLVIDAYINNKIDVMTDGTPWRPVIHIDDVCDCIETCINHKNKYESGNSFNLGLSNGNYQVKDLAKFVQESFNNIKINYFNKHHDPRSYKVSFTKFNNLFKDVFLPYRSVQSGINQLKDEFYRINFKKIYKIQSEFKRLTAIKELIISEKIDKDLFYNEI